MPDFFALIHKDSKYFGQDGGKPFPITLSHSCDGYIWNGPPGRYRQIDILLLDATNPLEVVNDEHVPVVFDIAPKSDEEYEEEYQRALIKAEWFRPLPHQFLEAWFSYVSIEGCFHYEDR